MGEARRVRITETVLRDAHQSLIATRMSTKDMLPVLERMDEAGYWALEMWGGATFDSCMRFLDEDPWDRLRLIRSRIKRTKLQMLLRGQNLVGYRHYADDVAREFVKRAVGNGIDIVWGWRPTKQWRVEVAGGVFMPSSRFRHNNRANADKSSNVYAGSVEIKYYPNWTF